MKLVVAGLLVGSSLLVAGCAVYPDGTPAYANGGYAAPAPAYQAYPGGYAPGYYDAPVAVAQPSVVIESGGGYYGGGGPRYYDDRRPRGYNGDRGGYGGDRGDRGDRGQNRGGPPQGGGQPGRGGPQQNAGGPGQQGGHGGPQQNGQPPQQARPQPAPQQQARGNTPYVGRSLWGKPQGVQSERDH